MIESYLGQQNIFLWKVFVRSCEKNLSPEMVKLTCMGGKYCTCSHVFGTHVCVNTHTHTPTHTHWQWLRRIWTKCSNINITHTHTHTQTQMSWPLTVGHVAPHISDTTDQNSQHFLDICSPAVWVYSILRHLLIICTCYTHTGRQTRLHAQQSATRNCFNLIANLHQGLLEPT